MRATTAGIGVLAAGYAVNRWGSGLPTWAMIGLVGVAGICLASDVALEIARHKAARE